MNYDFLIGILIPTIITALYLTFWEKPMKTKKTKGSGRFERVCALYLQLEDLRKQKADFISNQNDRIKTTQDAITKLVKEDPNQTEIELEEKK